MKFDRWFSEKTLDFWLQHYLRYKFAKHLLLPRTLKTQLSIEHSVSIFLDVLREERTKVEYFYSRVIRMKKEKWAAVIDRLHGAAKDNRQLRVLQDICEGIYQALTNLSQFADANYKGIRHLLDKERERLAYYGATQDELDKFEAQLNAVITKQCEFVGTIKDDVLHNSATELIENFQREFATHYFDNDLEGAKRCLETLAADSQMTRASTFMIGLFLGFAMMTATFLVFTCYEAGLDVDYNRQFSLVFPLFRGVIVFSLYSLLLGGDFYLWNLFVIDFKHLMMFRSNIPPTIRFLAKSLMLIAVLLICFGMYIFVQAGMIKDFWIHDYYIPLISWVFFAFWILCPLQNWIKYSGRTYLFKVIAESLISPFSKVEFSHIFVIDQFSSLIIPLTDLEYAVCYYSKDSLHSVNCTDKYRFAPILIMILPFFVRTLQSFRLAYDSGSFSHPQIINAGKFLSSIAVILANYAYKYYGGRLIYVWVACALFSTIYSISWDLMRDWGLISKHAYNLGLRRKLIYKRPWVYYLVIVTNLLLRFSWTLSISPTVVFEMMRPELFTMFIGIGEAYRRIQWNLLRVEWEQLATEEREGRLNVLHNQESFAKPLLSDTSMTCQGSLYDIESAIRYHREMLRGLEIKQIKSKAGR
jgi:hypothetical protein